MGSIFLSGLRDQNNGKKIGVNGSRIYHVTTLPGEFAYIWRSEPVGMMAFKFQRTRSHFSTNISSMRRSVSSPDEILRRELKIQHAVEYFWRTSRCFIWWWITVSNAWYYFSNELILEGEIKDAKMSSFSSDFQTLIKHKISFVFSLWIINELTKDVFAAVAVVVSYC